MPAFDEEKQIRKLVEMYRRGFDDVLKTIVSKEAKGLWTAYHRKLLLAIQAILIQLDEDAQQWIDETIGQVYAQATAETAAFLLGLGIAQDASKFAQLHQRAIDVLVQNMTDNLRDASQFVGRRVDDIFRKIAVEQAGAKYASGTTIDEMKKQVLKELLDNGQTAFIDKAGRKWRLDTYAEMVARTTTREAASVATINTCKEFGVDLVKISTHYPTCERCAALQGKVYCISGEDKRYPKLEDEYRPPLHPRCRHVINPYIRELDDDADAVQEHSNTSLTDDPRSDEEKQAYKEIRDQVTIATNRRRAREVLFNKSAPAEEKAKAAKALKKSYEKTGTKPVGKDASILKQYQEWVEEKAGLRFVGDIDPKMFSGIAKNISSVEVVLTDERRRHIEERHPGDLKKLEKHIAETLKEPDYILRDKKHEKTGLVIKRLDDSNALIALRLHTTDDALELNNSIITMMAISERRLKRYLRTAEIVYTKEK